MNRNHIISTAAAHLMSVQHLRGIRDLGAVYDSLVSNVAYRLFGSVSSDDARVLAVEQFGSASDPRAAAFIRHLVGLRQREFVLTTRDRISFFRSATLDFRAMAQAREEHADRIRAAEWALSAQELPPPVRLWDVGGPRPLAPQAPLPPIQPRPTRRRSFLG